jgi:hypothetical protein
MRIEGKPEKTGLREPMPSTNGMPTAAELIAAARTERVNSVARFDYQTFGNVERVFGEGVKIQAPQAHPRDVINEGAWIHRIGQ